ncbi:response regulator [Planctomycetota bacterium]
MKIIKPLSTGEVARYCRVSAVTVFNWIKGGKIKYHTTAGGQYRVERVDLVEFLKHYGMPVSKELLVSDKYKVLAVDDDVAFLEVVKGIFENDDKLELTTAEDGYTACMKIGSLEPDLLLLDIIMPKIDGVQVCQKVRENPDTKKIEIVVMTGVEDDEIFDSLKKLGVKTILLKPIKVDRLREAVYKALKIPQE